MTRTTWADYEDEFADFFERQDSLAGGMMLRRVRLAIKSQLWNDWYSEIDMDFAEEATAVKDAYISYRGLFGRQRPRPRRQLPPAVRTGGGHHQPQPDLHGAQPGHRALRRGSPPGPGSDAVDERVPLVGLPVRRRCGGLRQAVEREGELRRSRELHADPRSRPRADDRRGRHLPAADLRGLRHQGEHAPGDQRLGHQVRLREVQGRRSLQRPGRPSWPT